MVFRDYPGSFHRVQAEEKKGATDGPWEHGSIRLGAFLAAGMNSDVTFGIEDVGLGIVLDAEEPWVWKVPCGCLKATFYTASGVRDVITLVLFGPLITGTRPENC